LPASADVLSQALLSPAVADCLSDGIMVLNKSGVAVLWNRAAEALTGWRREEVLGLPACLVLLHHFDAAGLPRCPGNCPLAQAAAKSGMNEISSIQFFHQDGHPVQVWLKSLPVRNDKGDIAGTIQIFNYSARPDEPDRVRALAKIAFNDSVTSLFNWQYAEIKLRNLLEEAATAQPFGVIGITVLDLKKINDTYGSEIGDRVLRTVAHALVSALEEDGIVSRWQSAKFLIIFTNARRSLLLLTANKLKSLLEEISISAGAARLPVKVALAAAMALPGDTVTGLTGRLEKLLLKSEMYGKVATDTEE